MPDYVKGQIYAPFMETGKRQRNPTELRQVQLENMYQRILGELCMNRFQWTGFPESVDVRYLEMQLYFNALAVGFVDKNTDKFLVLRGTATGQRNLTDNPLSFTLTAPSTLSSTIPNQISARHSVPIWANYFRAPDLDIVINYAWKLAQIDRTIEINVNSARRTKVIVHNENQRLSASNINRSLDNGDSVIALNTPLGELISAVDLGVNPDAIEKLSIVRGRLWNECMGMLGINNANSEKKERVQSAEVQANDDQVATAQRVNLNARQEAAGAINAKFGAQYGFFVEVDYYSGQQPEIPEVVTEPSQGE